MYGAELELVRRGEVGRALQRVAGHLEVRMERDAARVVREAARWANRVQYDLERAVRAAHGEAQREQAIRQLPARMQAQLRSLEVTMRQVVEALAALGRAIDIAHGEALVRNEVYRHIDRWTEDAEVREAARVAYDEQRADALAQGMVACRGEAGR